MRIKISTDSTADIPVAIREQLNIEVLPLTILAGDKEFRDGYDITPEDFWPYLETEDKLPTSAQVNPYLYTELFEKTWKEGYTDLIHTCLNSHASATWQGCMNARTMFYEEHPEAKDVFNIHIIDSKTYSIVYGAGVIEAARMAQNGATPAEIIAAVEDWLTHARVLVIPMNLKCVRKSGRISSAAALIGDAMGIKPVITFEGGDTKTVSKIRGVKKAATTLVEMCHKEKKPGTRYHVAYGCDEAEYAHFRELCVRTLGEEPELEVRLGCIISINIGPDYLGILYRT